MEHYVAVTVGQDNRLDPLLGRGCDEEAPVVHEPPSEGKALGTVVVPRDHHHLDLEVEHQAREKVIQQKGGVDRGDGPVVDIPAIATTSAFWSRVSSTT